MRGTGNGRRKEGKKRYNMNGKARRTREVGEKG